ncbi:MAG: DUF624 domain-containing protein [Saccharofermentans sp.]|nr:DUF624 domain-containing protein [Saccharofermentans sp.]
MGFLRYDSPLMRLLSKAADLIWLNILCLLCSLPVFTIGASFTAMQTIFYRLLHNEDVYVTREYFASFARNFKQATLVWFIFLFIYAFLGFDYLFLIDDSDAFGFFLKTVAAILLVIVFLISLYVFPILSRYENTTKETLKNACIIAISHPFRSIIMLLVFAFSIFVEIIMSFKLLPVLFAFCISVPFYFCSMVYMPIFDKLDGVTPGQPKEIE